MSLMNIGSEVQRGDTLWRIIRITQQTSLFESHEKVEELVYEELIELKSTEGEVDFIVQRSERTPWSGDISSIKAPSPLHWKSEPGGLK